MKRGPQISGAPDGAAAIIAAALFDAIKDRFEFSAFENKPCVRSVKPESKRRYGWFAANLVLVAGGLHLVRAVHRQRNGRFMFPEMD